MLTKARYAVLLAIGLGLLASVSVYRYLLRYDAMVEAQEIATEPVVVVARDIQMGQEITGADVRVAAWPIEIIPAQRFTSADQVVGRVSRHTLVHGEPVLEPRLAPAGSEQGLAATIPSGHRAMTVPVNLVSGVSGFVLPGSHVDVLVSMRPAGRRDPATKTILQNVRVLAVDQEIEGRDGRPRSSRGVTLLVEPLEAEKLGLASTEGTLLLALRSATDQGTTGTSGITVAKLMGPESSPRRRRPPPPVAPPEPTRTKVEVIRGTNRSAEELDD